MKNLLVASVLALAVTAASGQKASAEGGFGFGFGIKLGFSFSVSGHCDSSCYPPSCHGCGGGYSYVPPYYGPWNLYAGGHDHGAAHHAPAAGGPGWQAPAPAGAPTSADVHPSAYWYGAAHQPVGYYAPAGVPSYWYGR